MHKFFKTMLLAAFLAGATPTAKAGIPVIDVSNLAQAIQQVAAWGQQYQQMLQQLQQMQQQLQQMRQQYAAITGGRGMESLLQTSNLARNYLPPDYGELMQAVNGASSTYAGLSSQVQAITSANAVLSQSHLGTMSPQMRQVVEQGRSAASMLSAMTQTAQQNTSQRFASLQQLITQIGSAGDTKAIQDLQARIAAEQAMLTNDQSKLQALYQSVQAETLLRQQRTRETAVKDVGSISSIPTVIY